MHYQCVRCIEKDSERSPMGHVALHTFIGRECRRRKGSEPSRRLSETDRAETFGHVPRRLPSAEVTKGGARCKRRRQLSHTAHRRRRRGPCGFTRYRDAPGAAAHVPVAPAAVAHMFPRRSRGTRGGGVEGDGRTVHPLPRAHDGAVHTFPERSAAGSGPRGADGATSIGAEPTGGSTDSDARTDHRWCGRTMPDAGGAGKVERGARRARG